MDSELAAQLLAATAGGGALVATLVTIAKATLLPEAWHFGRAPMILALLFSVALVLLAGGSVGLDPAAPGGLLAVVTAVVAVYSAAIATHQTVTKAGRVAAGTTNTSGPDEYPTGTGPGSDG